MPTNIVCIGEFEQHLREAMKKGYVYVKLVKVIVQGPAGVGKTSLIYLLLSKSPPDKRNSTGCAERAIRVIRVGKEGGEWSEISTKEFEEMIAEAAPILYEELKAKGKGMEGLAEVLSVLSEERKKSASDEGEKSEGEQSSNEREENISMDGKGSSIKTISDEDSNTIVSKVIQKITQLMTAGKSSRRLLDMDLIYITDCGGQQPYWDLAPIFTYDTSATLFMHRLCEKLDDHPLNDLYKSGEQVGPSKRASLTTAEAFKTMLRGLHEGGTHSKVIAVGTHKDLVDECEETPEEKNKKLSAIALPHFKDDVVYCNEDMKEMVFQVNTKNPDDDDKKVAKKIRACVEEGAYHHQIPIWWFVFQLILEALSLKLGRDVLSKDECIQISDTLGFSEGELDAALAFFDKLNIFLYKKNILPDVVFTSAQVPLDKLSKLVEEQYFLKAAEAGSTVATDRAMTGEWKKFRDSGILTLKFLERFKEHYVDGVFTANEFLVLLQKLLIVSPLSTTEYFFPAILKMTADSQINRFLVSTPSKIAALVVEFPTGWAPPGVYCCSVCHLQSHAHWEVVEKACTPTTTPGSTDTPHTKLPPISRNSITFSKRGRPGSVTFIDNFSFFVLRVNIDATKLKKQELVKHCQDIRSELFAALEAGLETTHHTELHPIPAFLCLQHCHSELHTAHVSDNGKRWICSKNCDVFNNLTSDQIMWISGLREYLLYVTTYL